MSLTKTAYHQLEAVGNGHVFVNPISVKADVHFAVSGTEDDSDESDYHTESRSASDDLEMVKLKQNNGGRRLLADSGRLLSSSSNYSVSSYGDYEHVYEKNDVVAFKPKKVAIAFKVLEDDDDDVDDSSSLMHINEALNSLDEVLLYGHDTDDHLDYDDDEEDSHSLYSSYSMTMSTYSEDTSYNSSLLSRRTSDMSISVDGQHSDDKVQVEDNTSHQMSSSSSASSTEAMISFTKTDHHHQNLPISQEASFVASADRRASAPMIAAAVAVAASKRTKQVGPSESSVTAAKSNRRQFIRRVERFGTDLFDPCLFPLALPMDGSDIYKGASTWESINLYADCVLLLWTEAAEKRKAQPLANQKVSNSWENAVLGNNSSRYLVLQPQVPDRLFLSPDCRLPFRRTASETDLTYLGIGLALNQTPPNRLVSSQKSIGGESVYSMGGDDEEADMDGENMYQDRKNRSRSSLTTTNLAKRLTSLKEAAKDQRKDRFNLNLAKNMKTEARRLASRSELQNNAYKFAKKISKLEKRYYLAVAGREFMSLLFKKGGGGGGTRASSGHLPDLTEMLDFGQELSQLVADLLCSAFTVDEQGTLLANVIETAFTLHTKGNLQSFKSVMRGLQLPEVYRLKSAWAVLKQKYPLHLRIFITLTVLLMRKVDQTMLHSSAPCLPTLTAFVDLLRIRCLAIWDQLEAASSDLLSPSPSLSSTTIVPKTSNYWKTTYPSSNLVSFLAAHPVDEKRLEKELTSKMTSDLEGKLKRFQVKQQITSRKGQNKNKVSSSYTAIPLKRLLHSESKTMATVLRKEAKLNGRPIGRDSISRLAKVAAGDSIDGGPRQQQQSLLLPVTWSRRSLRHLPQQYQIPVIREFNSLYGQLIASIEEYRFGDWADG